MVKLLDKSARLKTPVSRGSRLLEAVGPAE
jgi:hypothetical protein